MGNNYFSDFSPTKDSFEPIEEGLYRSHGTGDKIYLVKEGKKYWITSPEVLKELGYELGQEKMYDNLSNIQSGEPIKISNLDRFKKSSEEASAPVPDAVEASEEVILPPHEQGQRPHTIVEGLTSIIIPAVFNSYQMFHLTGDCIGAIREHTDKEKTPYEIILVINGKQESIDPKYTYADKVIQNEENEGYAKAINKGIRVAQGEYIVAMNNDIKVFNHWLEDLVEASKIADLVAATPMYSRTEPWKRAIEASLLRDEQMRLPIEETLSDFEDFACVFIKRAVFMEIGLFDEQFFLTAEDVDFKRRMKEKGFVYKSSKRVNVHHIGGATDIPGRGEIMNEAKEKYANKWKSQ